MAGADSFDEFSLVAMAYLPKQWAGPLRRSGRRLRLTLPYSTSPRTVEPKADRRIPIRTPIRPAGLSFGRARQVYLVLLGVDSLTVVAGQQVHGRPGVRALAAPYRRWQRLLTAA